MSTTEGWRVCVTGAASGLGLVIARRFHSAGSRVHVCDQSAEALAQALSSHSGLHGSVADVAVPQEVETLFAEAIEWMGGIDVLVNCAGVCGPHAGIEAIAYEDWDATLRANLSGMFYCIKQVVPLMKEQASGCIINIAATSAHTAQPRRTPLVASKAGVLGLTGSLARELGPHNIRCNAIVPGRLRPTRRRSQLAAGGDGLDDAGDSDYGSMRTIIDPREVADTVLFLASDAACHITGQTIGVCGNGDWDG